MDKYVKIVTNDLKFKRLLTLELEDIGITVKENLRINTDGQNNCYILADLDFCFEEDVAEFKKSAFVIGFSHMYENDIPEKASYCSFFLHRPFRMAELISFFSSDDPATPKKRHTRPTRSTVSIPAKSNNRAIYITIDHAHKCAVLGETRIALSDNEYKIFALLCENRGETVSRESLSSVIGSADSNICDVYICFLRKKLENKFGLKFIYTVRGQGYTLK